MRLQRVVVGFIVASAAATVVGFVLPWAHLDLHQPGVVKDLTGNLPLRDTLGGLSRDVGRIAVKIRRGTEVVTGTLPSLSDVPKEISGFQIPRLANSDKAQVAVALVELITNRRQQLGLESYAVYLVPGLALMCGALLLGLRRHRSLVLAIGGLCLAIAGTGYWKLLTTNTHTLFVAMTIGPGLWLSLGGYVGLGVSAGVQAFAAKEAGG